jgi:PAS domain S-box-containing protein
VIPHLSERAMILAPIGRDASVAAAMLQEIGVRSTICGSLGDLVTGLEEGAGFVVTTEEVLRTTDLHALSAWIEAQPEWSDIPFVLLTSRGGGLERNPAAGRYLDVLGNVTFLERPFHPTTLISVAKSALRGRRRQYEARARLVALNESERQFRTLAESIPTLCWIAEADGHIFWYNRQWYEYTGTQAADMEGWGWQSVHDPEVLGTVLTRWQRSLETGSPFEMVFPLRRRDGVFRPFLTRVQPVRNAEGTIVRWFGTNTDITVQRAAEAALEERAADLEQRVEERTAEREAALAQLHEAQKLETLGQLTGGVAHDFNNLLTPITGALDLLQRKVDLDSRSARLIGNALQSAERAKTLVQRLLGFARRQTLQTRAVDLGPLIEGMRDLVASSVGSTIEIRIRSEPDLPPALADPNQLELAILNLCVNARDAMPEGGVLTIVAEQAAIGPRSEPKLTPGLYVRLSVIDTGTGMDQDTLARAVEPFFSTKETGRGTGLGLSMVHGLAGQLGGGFSLASASGEGTRADLYLPVTGEAVRARPHGRGAGLVEAGPALAILLVDDEELVRAGTAEMLRDLGHTVTEASGGAQALGKLAAGLHVDAVVTDYKMPRIDGAELAGRIRETRPQMPVLLITGYTGIVEQVADLPQLAKPFVQADLAEALARLVGGDKIIRFPMRPRGRS